MGAERGEDVHRLEQFAVRDVVLTDADVEPLPGGLVRLRFFCARAPLDTTTGTELVLQASAVTTEELWCAIARKIDFALAEHRRRRRCRSAVN